MKKNNKFYLDNPCILGIEDMAEDKATLILTKGPDQFRFSVSKLGRREKRNLKRNEGINVGLSGSLSCEISPEGKFYNWKNTSIYIQTRSSLGRGCVFLPDWNIDAQDGQFVIDQAHKFIEEVFYSRKEDRQATGPILILDH